MIFDECSNWCRHFLLQLTGDLTQANDKVSLMQQNCLDDILNREYTESNDTVAVVDETRRTIEDDLLPHICQPFDCSGNGQCVNGTCVCDAGMYCMVHFNYVSQCDTICKYAVVTCIRRYLTRLLRYRYDRNARHRTVPWALPGFSLWWCTGRRDGISSCGVLRGAGSV